MKKGGGCFQPPPVAQLLASVTRSLSASLIKFFSYLNIDDCKVLSKCNIWSIVNQKGGD